MQPETRDPQHSRFWSNLALDVFVGCAFAWLGITRYDGSPDTAAVVVITAMFVWPFIEYIVHRWLMHGPIPAMSREHLLHHSRPEMTFTTPWSAHLLVGLPSWAALAAITSSGIGALLMTGVYAGFTWFRFVHRMVHFHAQTVGARFFGSALRRHDQHHAQPDHLFGVTSPICDGIFGTFSRRSGESR
jgi:4-hydroxysphinganine ceramide fatty acyl 2-hydroxylase